MIPLLLCLIRDAGADSGVAAATLAQFDGLERAVSANVRLNYTFRPGSDFFVVFNERRGSERSVWDFDERAVVVKVSYLTRF